MLHQDLSGAILGCCMKVHTVLGPGYLESVYEKALAHELSKAGISAVLQQPLAVQYDGIIVGHFAADIVVENKIIIELKAVQALTQAHEVQLVSYLTTTGIDIGLLVNFGAQRLEFKRKTRLYKPMRDVPRPDGQKPKNRQDEQD